METTNINSETIAAIKTERVNGAYALLDSLKRHGVKHIFGYPGGATLPIYDEIYKAEQRGDIQHILVRHEQGAAHAADGYARATGKVGVCLATSGPGATNIVTGLATAHMDSVPIIVITGQVPRSLLGTDGFQEVDIFGITLPIVKHSYIISKASEIPRVIAEAFHIASSGRPGPVLIDIPKDVGAEIFDYIPIEPGSIKLIGYRPTVKGNPRQLKRAIELIQKAERPLLYVGGGAIIANAHVEIEKLAKTYNIPVTTTLMGKGIFDESDPLALGMLGMHGTAYSNYAVSECDLLIAVGVRFDDRVAGKRQEFAQQANVIHIDIDPAEMGKNRQPDVPIVGDVLQVLQDLWEIMQQQEVNIPHSQTQLWFEHLQQLKQTYPLVPSYPANSISPQEVIVEVARQCPHAYYTTDVGQHQMWAAQFLKNLPRHWMTSGGLGTMGYGVPAAVGVKVAFADEPVICISGDGSFQMNMQELGTIAQYGLGVKIVILNNGWLGMVRQWQHLFYNDRYEATNLQSGSPAFCKLADVYGIKGILVQKREELTPAIAEMLAHPGAVILEVRVESHEDCYPMIAPGQGNTQMMGVVPNYVDKSRATSIICRSCGTENLPHHKCCCECGTKL
ncbi:biosynthetic-type acetolactate synthase large subunit [Gloeothece verrucosa]|uniref:Acetolactate synthase n=1 Tax=Gloeothece verrucosa (strain PCC 7822) TaxID=497965 RepID=E0UHE3_GLOV7|nr:biosynthetic-type acetolactate synthase large subunit [Gloeothece verrucosa]ADN12084.1 acetolactate synthase, large subunit, biosynthetic type [Gloeothece verrucosa PCC 7822]